MKKHYLLLLCCCLFCSVKLNAQDIASTTPTLRFVAGPRPPTPDRIINLHSISNYHFYNPFSFNPAMAGIEDKRRFNLNWNRQAQHAFSGSYEQPIASINSAIGIQYEYRTSESDEIHRYGLTYNYGFRWKENTQLKFGVQFSHVHILIDEFSYFPLERDKWYDFPSLDLGVAFQFKQLRLGASIQNLVAKKFALIDEEDGSILNQANTKKSYNFSAANTFRLSKKWAWSVAFLLRFSDEKFYDNFKYSTFVYETIVNNNQHDFSTYLSFRKIYSIGATYRTQYLNPVWIGFVGIQFKEKLNLQFSCNMQKEENEPRFFEALTQYQF